MPSSRSSSTGKLVWEAYRGNEIRRQRQWANHRQRHPDCQGRLSERPLRLLRHRTRRHDRQGTVAEEVIPRRASPATRRGAGCRSRAAGALASGDSSSSIRTESGRYGSTGICPASDFPHHVAGRISTRLAVARQALGGAPRGLDRWCAHRQLLPPDDFEPGMHRLSDADLDTAMRANPKAEGMSPPTQAVAREKVRSLVGMPRENPVFSALGAGERGCLPS